MGKITGFMEFKRLEESYQPVAERVKNQIVLVRKQFDEPFW